MSDALSALGTGMSSPTGKGASSLAQLLLGGSGILGNLFQSKDAASRQKMLDALSKNPALLSAMIRSATQPLQQGLVQDVTNKTQGQLAERGLGTSPQIAASVESQALAPYELKNEEIAQQEVMTMLGLDVGSPHALPGGPSDTSGFWKLFQPQSTPGGGGGGGGISNYPIGGGPGGGGGGTGTPDYPPSPDDTGF